MDLAIRGAIDSLILCYLQNYMAESKGWEEESNLIIPVVPSPMSMQTYRSNLRDDVEVFLLESFRLESSIFCMSFC